MERKGFEMPVFFPSASRVKVPFVGDDTRDIKPLKVTLGPLYHPLIKHQKSINKLLLKRASQNVCFSMDVIKERSLHSLPYNEHDALNVYDCSDIIPPSQISQLQSAGGRFNTRGYRQKVLDQFHKKAFPKPAKTNFKLKTVTERYGNAIFTQAINKSVEKRKADDLNSDCSKNATTKELKRSLNKTGEICNNEKEKKKLQPGHWDEQLIDKLSKDTARWIVAENIETGSQKERLDFLLKQKFGTKFTHADLIQEYVCIIIYTVF